MQSMHVGKKVNKLLLIAQIEILDTLEVFHAFANIIRKEDIPWRLAVSRVQLNDSAKSVLPNKLNFLEINKEVG